MIQKIKTQNTMNLKTATIHFKQDTKHTKFV